MEEKKISLCIQISGDIYEMLSECSKAEKRSKRGVVEIALEEHFERSEALRKHLEAK